MTNSEFQILEGFRKNFKNLEKCLLEIRMKLNKKEGFWLVKWHTYESEELLKDPNFSRIDAFIGTIAANVTGWLEHNNVTTDFIYRYDNMRDNFEQKIEVLQQEIVMRQPTFWETIKSGFTGFFMWAIKKLPKIAIKYLTGTRGVKLLE